MKDEEGKEKKLENNEGKEVKASCLPKYAPGFNFWEEGDADALCIQASRTCTIKVSKSIIGILQGGRSIGSICEEKRDAIGEIENCDCLEDSWLADVNNACLALGDCGVSENYLGEDGFHELDDLFNRDD